MIPFSDTPRISSARPVITIGLITIISTVFLIQVISSKFGILFGTDNLETITFFYKWGFIPRELSTGISYVNLFELKGLSLCADFVEKVRSACLIESIPSRCADFVEQARGDCINRMKSINIESAIPTSLTLVTSMFLHGGAPHFLGNMLFLWVFGDNVEHRLGVIKYVLLYFTTGVVAGLTQYWIDPTSGTVLVGASGAISGVMGAYILLFPSNRVRVLFMVVLITVAEIRALYVLGLWFLWQAVQALLQIGMSSTVQVAFMAHVGGFLAGMLLVCIFTNVLLQRRQ